MCQIKSKRKLWENAKQKRHRRSQATTMTSTQLKQGIMDGTIASTVSDTGATSTAGTPNDPFVMSNQGSNKVFCLPTYKPTDPPTKPCMEKGTLPKN